MYQVNQEKCMGCGQCIDVCPANAISMVNGIASIETNLCKECGICVQACPYEAVYSESQSQQSSFPNQDPLFPGSGLSPGKGMGTGLGSGRGMGRGTGRGLGRGPRDGRGGGKGGGGRKW